MGFFFFALPPLPHSRSRTLLLGSCYQRVSGGMWSVQNIHFTKGWNREKMENGV